MYFIKSTRLCIVSGAYDKAKGRHAALKFRAELISDYETIENPFGNKKGYPRYIYFIILMDD